MCSRRLAYTSGCAIVFVIRSSSKVPTTMPPTTATPSSVSMPSPVLRSLPPKASNLNFPASLPKKPPSPTAPKYLKNCGNLCSALRVTAGGKEAKFAQGLYGYTTYDAVQFFDTVKLGVERKSPNGQPVIPLMRYRLYQYVIAINHHKDELFICENVMPGVESELAVVESLIRSKDVPVYPFKAKGPEASNMTDTDYMDMVKKVYKLYAW